MKKPYLTTFGMVAMIISLGVFFRVSLVRAQVISTANASTDGCQLSAADFAALKAVQNDPTLSSSDEFTQELALRKQLLGKTIDCAKSDDTALLATLSGITVDTSASTIQTQLEGRINDAINFYQLESTKLQDSGFVGTQSIAKELIAWRAANDAPLAGQMNDLLLWSQNQALFSTAASRVTQTGRVISFIESATQNSDLQTAYNNAQAAFQAAQSANMNAKTDLAQFLPPDQSLTVIQQSLQSLAIAYQKLSDLNTLLQQLLPTGNQ